MILIHRIAVYFGRVDNCRMKERLVLHIACYIRFLEARIQYI